MRYIFLIILLLAANNVYSHEFTPAYPKLVPSYLPGIYVAKMKLLNKRKEIEYYQITVLSDDMEPIRFGSSDEILKLKYLSSKKVEVYISKENIKKARFICSTSKILKIPGQEASVISSKICSRIK